MHELHAVAMRDEIGDVLIYFCAASIQLSAS
jgi:hypothetical protein